MRATAAHALAAPPLRGRGQPRVVVSVPLRVEQMERLRRISADEDLPCSTLIRQSVDLLLREREAVGR